jgi:CheY-like chemotaxis protein
MKSFCLHKRQTDLKSILVVDDDFAMRRGIALMLQGEGYEVFEAGDGRQALQALGEKPVDLVILDLFLPGRDGIEIAREIGAGFPDTKILLLTAYGDHERAKEAQQIFKENYLEKTSLERTLLEKVQSLLAQKP